MPPKTEKGRREAQEVGRFVRELYSVSGFKSWGEFARAVGIAPATISDYKRGENAAGGYLLIKMIRAAGWQPSQATKPLNPTPVVDRLEELQALVVAFRAEMEQGRLIYAEALRGIRDGIESIDRRLSEASPEDSGEAQRNQA